MTNDTMTKKKYILKPGKHQFAPKSPPIHHNDNLTDEEAEWYLEKYPHIRLLFTEAPESVEFKNKSLQSPQQESVESQTKSVESQNQKSVKSNNNEDLSTTN
jgi:hypothetical protein